MAKIKLTIDNEAAQATLIEGPLAAKNANTEVEVSVSGEMWEGLGLKLVASCNGVDRDAPIIDGKALVPWECMIAGYHLNVGIQGGDGENPSIYTVLGDAGVVLRSTGNAKIEQGLKPTPSLADKIIAAFNDLIARFETIWHAYHDGTLKGDDGFSPKVTVNNQISGEHWVKIEDAAGMHSFTVYDGKDGKEGKPGKDGPIGPAGPAYDDTKINEDLSHKLTEPESIAVGKYFRIAAIDENGHAVLEAVDSPSGGLDTVPSHWPTWTEEEQLAGRQRLGLPGKYALIEEYTLTEDTTNIDKTAEPDGTPYNFLKILLKFEIPAGSGVTIQGAWIAINGEICGAVGPIRSNASVVCGGSAIFDVTDGLTNISYSYNLGSASNPNASVVGSRYNYGGIIASSIKRLLFTPQVAFPPNTTIKIYGIRA